MINNSYIVETYLKGYLYSNVYIRKLELYCQTKESILCVNVRFRYLSPYPPFLRSLVNLHANLQQHHMYLDKVVGDVLQLDGDQHVLLRPHINSCYTLRNKQSNVHGVPNSGSNPQNIHIYSINEQQVLRQEHKNEPSRPFRK